MKSGIYRIRNLQNNHIYIGSSLNLERRNYDHFWKLNKNKHTNKHLQSAWNKYSSNSFVFEIIENCLPEELIEREQHYIDTLKPIYNIRKIAKSNYGLKASDETKRKIGNVWRGRKHTPETLLKLSELHKDKHPSEATRKKMGESQKSMTEEKRKNISRRQGKAHLPEDARKKWGIAHVGTKHSQETKSKMSKSHLGKKFSKESLRKRSLSRNKPICQIDLNENIIIHIFASAQNAEERTQLNRETIANACREEKQLNGYRWKYMHKKIAIELKAKDVFIETDDNDMVKLSQVSIIPQILYEYCIDGISVFEHDFYISEIIKIISTTEPKIQQLILL